MALVYTLPLKKSVVGINQASAHKNQTGRSYISKRKNWDVIYIQAWRMAWYRYCQKSDTAAGREIHRGVGSCHKSGRPSTGWDGGATKAWTGVGFWKIRCRWTEKRGNPMSFKNGHTFITWNKREICYTLAEMKMLHIYFSYTSASGFFALVKKIKSEEAGSEL